MLAWAHGVNAQPPTEEVELAHNGLKALFTQARHGPIARPMSFRRLTTIGQLSEKRAPAEFSLDLKRSFETVAWARIISEEMELAQNGPQVLAKEAPRPIVCPVSFWRLTTIGQSSTKRALSENVAWARMI
jgi:hypothetical protein